MPGNGDAVGRGKTAAGGGMIGMESGVSARTGEGFVRLTWGTEEGQLSPTEIRAHALALLVVAEAAESDAIVYAELVDTIGLDRQAALLFIGALRHRRAR